MSSSPAGTNVILVAWSFNRAYCFMELCTVLCLHTEWASHLCAEDVRLLGACRPTRLLVGSKNLRAALRGSHLIVEPCGWPLLSELS